MILFEMSGKPLIQGLQPIIWVTKDDTVQGVTIHLMNIWSVRIRPKLHGRSVLTVVLLIDLPLGLLRHAWRDLAFNRQPVLKLLSVGS